MPEDSDPMAATVSAAAGSEAIAPAVPRSAPMLPPGTRVDRYAIEGRLGAGAMGVVYLAHDPELDRRIALKLIRGSGEGLHARLYREAQALARVAHPNVVGVHEVGRHEDQVFVAMELVRGETLRGWLARKPPLRDVVRILTDAGRGLAAAHAAGLVHRDFKPDNVLIGEDGRARVTDFGLARNNDDDDAGAIARTGSPVAPSPLYQSLTQTGMMVGTPVYASPEQLAGERVGPASDQFSFCITAYEALYGRRPFEATNLGDLMARVSTGAIAAPPGSRRGRRVPKRIERALRRGLAPSPADRHPSMTALLDELVVPPSRHGRTIAIGAAIAGVGLAAGLALAWRAGRGAGASAGSGDPVMPASCADAGAPVEAVWGPAASAALRDALAAAPLGAQAHAALASQLDRYAADWRAARITACRDAQIDGDLRRVRCLDQGLDVMRGLVADLTRPQVTPAYASTVIATLEPIALCRHAAAEPDARNLEQVRAARLEIARARASWYQNDHAGAKRSLLALLAQTEAVRYPPLRSEIYTALGAIALLESDPTAAEQHLRAALQIAETAGDDRNKVVAGIELIDALLARTQLDAAAVAADQAAATLARLGGDPASEARLAVRRARIAVARKQPAEAVPLLERALELSKQAGIEVPSEPILELARVHNLLGNSAAADALMDRAFQQLAPETREAAAARALTTFRSCEKAPLAGDLDRALRVCTTALEQMRAARGDDDPFVAPAHMGLGLTYELRGDHALARDHYLRAVAVFEKLGTTQHVPGPLEGAARASQELRELPAAIEHYRRAIELYRRLDGDNPERLVFARVGLGRALIERGEAAPAIVELEWAIPRLEVLKEVPRNSLASARISLAEALWQRDGRGDRARARVLADAARDDAAANRARFDGSGDPLNPVYRKRADLLSARVEAWFARHP